MPYILHPKNADQHYAEYAERATAEYQLAHKAYMNDPNDTPSRAIQVREYDDFLFAFYPDYDQRKIAHAAMVANHLESTHKITFIPTDEEYATWSDRERARFKSGEYIHVPWQAHDVFPSHYAHLSLTKPGLIAYSKDAEHGVSDRQTVVKPGKYLEEFYAGEFSSSQIATWIGQCGAKHLTLQVTQDRADIRTIYLHGPNSCMKTAFHYLPCHPAEVYAGPDLALAYYGDKSSANARAVVWPERKIYSRIYGNEHVLDALLKQAGFERGSLQGARVLKIACDRGYVMPYVDYLDYCKVGRSHITLGEGDRSCQNTDGFTRDHCANDDDDEDDDLEANYVTCTNCRNRYDPEDDDAGEFCARCMEDRYSCEHCGEGVWSRDVMRVGDNYYCEDCAHEQHDRECRHPDCDTKWLEELLTDERQGERLIAGVSEFCEDCEERGECFVCHVCDGVNTITDRCEHCHAAQRCTQTRDLLALNSDRIMESIAITDARTINIRFYFHGRSEACRAEYGSTIPGSINRQYGCCLPSGHIGQHMCPGELEREHRMDLTPYTDRIGYVIPVLVSILLARDLIPVSLVESR